MKKKIKIIHFVFKTFDSLNMLVIEEYFEYQMTHSKVKLLYDNNYYEQAFETSLITEEKMIFGNVIIEPEELSAEIGNISISWHMNNYDLIREYTSGDSGKSFEKVFDTHFFSGTIEDKDVMGKAYITLETIYQIPDSYYKIFAIDFDDFNGMFLLSGYEKKVSSLSLIYKDVEFKNKKSLKLKEIKRWKLSTFKLKVSGNALWCLRFNVKKLYKAEASIIPFRYLKGNMNVEMKKNLFKSNLKASSKEAIMVHYQFI